MSPSHPTKIWAVIPAAGSGMRMQSERPKQYLPLLGRTLIEITVNKMLQLPMLEGVVVVLQPNDPFWDKTALASHANVHRVGGGENRSDSVLNGLQYCKKMSIESKSSTWALVHDAARPCVSLEKIQQLIELGLSNAEQECADGAILAAPVADTVKRVLDDGIVSATEERTQLWLAHTPQFFPMNLLCNALQQCQAKGLVITDEASAIEIMGGRVAVLADRRDNIKVTLPEDLPWAETILKHQGFTL